MEAFTNCPCAPVLGHEVTPLAGARRKAYACSGVMLCREKSSRAVAEQVLPWFPCGRSTIDTDLHRGAVKC